MKRKDDPPLAGVLLIDKPAGLTSHDVVGRVRKALGLRRVGHAGTLDPMATGVLVVGVGPSTRLLGIVGGQDKEYEATIRLGVSTRTDDREGEEISRADVADLAAVTDERIAGSVNGFIGVIQQRPSAVSAVKIAGKRAYERVRSGEDVELPTRQVRIANFDVLDVRRGDGFIDVDVRVECSAGTYIRALARDLGAALGVGGHLTALRRTRSGDVRVAECIDVDEVAAQSLVPPANLARRELTCMDIDEATTRLARHGSPLSIPIAQDEIVALIGPGEDLVAIVTAQGGRIRYVAGFAPAVGPAAPESKASRAH